VRFHTNMLLDFWPTSVAEASTFLWSAIVANLLGIYVVWVGFPVRFQSVPTGDYGGKLVEWERDRSLGVAKGLAGTAAGFLTSLFIAVLKGEITANVSGLSLLGCVLGAVGALLLAAEISRDTTAFTRSPA
jgi:hypothetical protein